MDRIIHITPCFNDFLGWVDVSISAFFARRFRSTLCESEPAKSELPNSRFNQRRKRDKRRRISRLKAQLREVAPRKLEMPLGGVGETTVFMPSPAAWQVASWHRQIRLLSRATRGPNCGLAAPRFELA